MSDNKVSADALIDELNTLLEESQETTPEPVAEPSEVPQESKLKTLGRGLAKVGITILATVLLLVVTLYGVMYVLAKGPSPPPREICLSGPCGRPVLWASWQICTLAKQRYRRSFRARVRRNT